MDKSIKINLLLCTRLTWGKKSAVPQNMKTKERAAKIKTEVTAQPIFSWLIFSALVQISGLLKTYFWITEDKFIRSDFCS